uniref:DUF4485 domain-containing protein n=1 Tax=Cacopsylla melanoneura TaxID=428564 RepID=A0A8D8SHZ2_9HEMI
MASSRTAADIKVDIEFNSLKDYIRNIKSQLPRTERFLLAQWLKKLKKPQQTLFRADYISRLYTEIVHGYLCPPFSSEPPLGALEPLPPPHTHTSSECCTSLSSIVTNDTSFNSLALKNTGENGGFSGGNRTYTGGNRKYSGGNDRFSSGNGQFTGANGGLSDETPSSDCGDVATTSNEGTLNDDIVRVRSEPNLIKSKFHLVSRYSSVRNDSRIEETHEENGNLVEKSTRGYELSAEDTEDHEFQSKGTEFKLEGFEKGKPEKGTDNFRSGITPEDRVKICDELDNKRETEINNSEEDIVTMNSLPNTEGTKRTTSILPNTDRFDLIDTCLRPQHKTKALPLEDSLEKIFEKLVEEQLVAETCNTYKSKDGKTCKKTSVPKESLEKRQDSRLPTTREVREVLTEISNETLIEQDNNKKESSKLATGVASSLPIGKEVREVFMNLKYDVETVRNSSEPRSPRDRKQKYSLETTKQDSLEPTKQDSLEPTSLKDKKHIQDVIKKIANLCQKKHQEKIIDLEDKIAKITTLNEQLTDANAKNNSQIEELQKELGCLKSRHPLDDAGEMRTPNNETEEVEDSVTDTIFTIPCKDVYDNSKGNENLADIIDTLSMLLEKSNRHIEKLSSLAIKFNLIKSDYELERKEMIMKFKSIDSLHQNILTELVKQRVNEGKESFSL